MNIAWTAIPVLNLAASFLLFLFFLFFFVFSYRARASVWADSAAGGADLTVDELRKRGSVSGGIYLVETMALAASAYLLPIPLRFLGMAGVRLWVVSLGVAVLAPLVFAPAFLRVDLATKRRAKLSSRAASPAETRREMGGETPFSQTFFGAMGRFYAILAGWRGKTAGIAEVPETTTAGLPGEATRSEGRLASLESDYGRDVLRLLLRLKERHVSEVMISRVDMVCAEDSSTVSEVADLVREVAFTRIPVFCGSIDSITGYVTAKDVVIRLHQGGGGDAVSSIARKPVYVAADATIENALEKMQKARATLAIVTGPSGKIAGLVTGAPGKTAGLVTSEDILEEIVGDLYEDYEPEEPAYQIIDERTAIVRANVALGDLREIFGVAPVGDLNQTLGNYVRKELGAEPSKGERVTDGVFSYSVAKTTGKVIWSLKVEKKN